MNAHLRLWCDKYLQAGVSQEVLNESLQILQTSQKQQDCANSDIIFIPQWDSCSGIPANVNTSHNTTQVSFER